MKRARLVLVVLAGCGGSSEPAADESLPPSACTPPTQLVDTAGGHKIGDGTPASCTEAAFDAALAMGGVVYFDCGPEPLTIETSGPKTITVNTVVDGGGTVTLDGGGAHRLFVIEADPTMTEPILTVQRMTLARGKAPAGEGGGAIARRGGTLIVNEAIFRDHSAAEASGGAILAEGAGPTFVVRSVFAGNAAAQGGALAGSGHAVQIFNSRFEDNTASAQGGAVHVAGVENAVEVCGSRFLANSAEAAGGAIVRVGSAGAPVAITRSLFEENRVGDVDPAQGGAVHLGATVTTVTGVAFVANEAPAAGALFLGPATSIALSDSTFADNVARVRTGGAVVLDRSVTGTIKHSTFAGNRASGAEGAAGAVAGTAFAVTLSNSIFSGNRASGPDAPATCSGAFADGGGNLQFPVEPETALCTTGARAEDPKLGKLTEVPFEGGPDVTWVLAPGEGSPALGAGATGCSMADQRGKTRPLPCTIGAVEP